MSDLVHNEKEILTKLVKNNRQIQDSLSQSICTQPAKNSIYVTFNCPKKSTKYQEWRFFFLIPIPHLFIRFTSYPFYLNV